MFAVPLALHMSHYKLDPKRQIVSIMLCKYMTIVSLQFYINSSALQKRKETTPSEEETYKCLQPQ
jgi:hypothetical protein